MRHTVSSSGQGRPAFYSAEVLEGLDSSSEFLERMMKMATASKQQESQSMNLGTQIRFDSINEPGCYVCNWSGHLLRVPDDGIKPGRSPLLSIMGTEPLFTTKISGDPYVAVSKARILAANCDLNVNF